MVVLQPLALSPLSLPTYHNLRLSSWRSWVCYEHCFSGETVELFVSDSPHPAVPFILSPLERSAALCDYSEDCFWQETLPMGRAPSLSLPPRFVTGTDARILLAANWELGQLACSSPPLTVSVTSQELLQSHQSLSPQLFSFPACSHLCFITAILQDHSAHSSIASLHLENSFHSNRDGVS